MSITYKQLREIRGKYKDVFDDVPKYNTKYQVLKKWAIKHDLLPKATKPVIGSLDDDPNHISRFLRDVSPATKTRLASTFGVDEDKIAMAIRDTPITNLPNICVNEEILYDDYFWKAIFADVYGGVYAVFSSIKVNKRMIDFSTSYDPKVMQKSEKTKGYRFWEYLMAEMDAITTIDTHLKEFESVINHEGLYSEGMFTYPERSLIIHNYPFMSLFLGNRYPMFAKRVVMEDSPVFEGIQFLIDTFKEHWESINGPNLLMILLKDKNLSSETLQGVLMLAVKHSNSEILRLVLGDGRADPRFNDGEVYTALISNPRVFRHSLMVDPRDGKEEHLRLLLADGRVDPAINGNEVLRSITHMGFLKVLLEDERVDPTINDDVLYLQAVTDNNVEKLEILIKDERFDPRTTKRDLLQEAVICGEVEVLEVLLRDGRFDPTVNDNAAMRLPTSRYDRSNRSHNIVLALLEDGRADPTIDNNAAIRRAASEYQGGRTFKYLLLDGRADPSTNNNEALKVIVRKNFHNKLRRILDDRRVDITLDNGALVDEAIMDMNRETLKIILADERVFNDETRDDINAKIADTFLMSDSERRDVRASMLATRNDRYGW